MMLKYIWTGIVAVLWSLSPLLGNVGIFHGAGQTPRLGANAEIQLVEELVEMMPIRGNYPVDETCRNPDPMVFRCTFKLRNLSDKEVSVPVGFPVMSEGISFQNPSERNQADIIASYGFVAGTKDRVYPVRYVPHDADNKFSNLFLWEMTFGPKQEITLRIHYRVLGYMGLGETRKPGLKPEDGPPYTLRYLELFENSLTQGHLYVTETGDSWAGKIEKAVFRIYPFEFEKYLRIRGATERTPERDAERERFMKQRPFDMRNLMTPDLKMTRYWNPHPKEWRVVRNGRTSDYMELVRAPFEPEKNNPITIMYQFPPIPTNAEQFESLLQIVKKELDLLAERKDVLNREREEYRKNNPELYEKIKDRLNPPPPYLPEVEKNLADVVLEFYGIKTGNASIQDFLDNQNWYPVTDPHPLDPAFKKRLEQASSLGKKP